MQIADHEKCLSGEQKCGVLAMHISRPPAAASATAEPTMFVAFTDRMERFPAAKCDAYGKSA